MSSATQTIVRKNPLKTTELIFDVMFSEDPYTKGHSNRVAKYSELIGKHLGLSNLDLKTLKIGGFFHDIGKIGIPDNILLKTEKLTDAEFSEIKNHPNIGAQILSKSIAFQDIIPIVKYHHERYDGKGYPTKLQGSEIPYLARITAVADAFDAMTSKRSYRNSLSIAVVRDEIKNNSGTQFDPKIANAFLDILDNEPEEIEKIMKM